MTMVQFHSKYYIRTGFSIVELHQLRYFAAVARLGNFTRAAEACRVSQPTLSQQIAKLELELGHSLFDRLGRGIALTDSGRALREKAEQALALLDEVKETVTAAGKVGRVTVAAIPTVAPYFLPAALTKYAKANPNDCVEVLEYTTDECLQHLADGQLDLAVLALPVREEHLATETLFTEELLLAVAADHPLAKKPQVRLKDVADEPFILLHEMHCLAGQAVGFCARHALAPLITGKPSVGTSAPIGRNVSSWFARRVLAYSRIARNPSSISSI